jgi:tRNA-splicing ligase RtcB
MSLVMERTSGLRPGSERLTVLSCDQGPSAPLRASLEAIAERPFVEHVLALPDLHHKENAEVPSSLAVVTRGALVPEFTSVAINDGMGVVVTDLTARDITHDLLANFFRRINAHAASHVLARNKYSLSAPDLARAAFAGGAAVLERYGLDPRVLEAMESGGRVEVPGAGCMLAHVVPALLRHTPAGRCEMGLNFGGNHFLEVQVVEAIADGHTAARWGLGTGRVVVTYHLGPGPFSGTLLHFYSRRKALKGPRVPWFLLGKLGFHMGRIRRHPARTWATLFRRNGITALAPESEEGLHFRQALAMAVNVGYAYRLATVAAIRDALREAFRPPASARLLCDIPHNSLDEEQRDDGAVWVARHNACRWRPDRPAFIAGAHDVPSYLAIGRAGGAAELHSYDHGVGQLIEAHRHEHRLSASRDTTLRVTLARGVGGKDDGSSAMRAVEIVPVRSALPVERVLDGYERRGTLMRVARLRPLGTLKN